MKFCPRCGSPLELRVVDERARPACPNCHFVAYLNPALTVGVLATDDLGRVVLVRRGEDPGKGKWGLPAGYMEGDETAEAGAQRECLEETGLSVELERLWEVYSFRNPAKTLAGVLVLYRARIVDGTPAAGTDSVEVGLFSPQEIPFGEVAFSTHRKALERFVRESQAR